MKRKIRDPRVRRRRRRAASIRKRLEGTGERPRLTVFRSSRHIYAQLIDDIEGRTVASASTMVPEIRDAVKEMKKREAAEQVGARLAERAKEKGLTRVVFDRNGYPYHGRIAALAKGAREAGLEF